MRACIYARRENRANDNLISIHSSLVADTSRRNVFCLQTYASLFDGHNCFQLLLFVCFTVSDDGKLTIMIKKEETIGRSILMGAHTVNRQGTKRVEIIAESDDDKALRIRQRTVEPL